MYFLWKGSSPFCVFICVFFPTVDLNVYYNKLVVIFYATSFLILAHCRNGNIHEAWNYAVMAQKACTHDPNAQETRARLTNALVDRWHLPMLNDVNRNSVFKRAIEAAVNQGHEVVLDIGSGTGLLRLVESVMI